MSARYTYVPNTMQVNKTEWVASDTTDKVIFEPQKGEIWTVVCGDLLNSGATGTVSVSVRTGRSGDTADGSGDYGLFFKTSVSGQEMAFTDEGQDLGGNRLIGYPGYLWGDVQANGGSGTMRLSLVLQQVK
tara:strand:+ start:1057 stop:1449 length:393 start_codon:yes stop_codon:yes gene_type:complete